MSKGCESVQKKYKGVLMKTYLMAVVSALFMCGVACADQYTETETVAVYERVNLGASYGGKCGCTERFASSRDVKPCAKPCAKSYVKPCAKRAQPVRVKTHTEVIDHYQVYQPVTIYQPIGTEIQRRIVR